MKEQVANEVQAAHTPEPPKTDKPEVAGEVVDAAPKQSARERVAAQRRAQEEARAKAAAEKRARRTPEEELAQSEYVSDANGESKSTGARFGVDETTIDNARAAFKSAYEAKFLEARRAGVAERAATLEARDAARARMKEIVEAKATADAPGRAARDAQTDTQARGVPDAFAESNAEPATELP